MEHEQEYESENAPEHVSTQSSSTRSRNTGCRRIAVALAALVVLAIVYSVANIGSGRLSGGSGGFDASSSVYALAQQVEDYRTTHPDKRNYCIVALYLEDRSSTVTAGPSHVFPGAGTLDTHCEQVSLRWVKLIAFPKLSMANLKTVHIVLFSQVRVCDPCLPTFKTWQQDLQQSVPQGVSVDLSVFEIAYLSRSGFDPRLYPGGPFTKGTPRPGTTKPLPVRPQDIDRVF